MVIEGRLNLLWVRTAFFLFYVMNIRKVVLSGVWMAVACAGWAHPVSEAQALEQAEAFYYQKTSSVYRVAGRSLSLVPRFDVAYVAGRKGQGLARGRAAVGEEVCFYVVNVNTDEGFVVVAGDDRARPVLAYSLDGAFRPDELPDNCRSWLRGYQEEIARMQEVPDNAAEGAVLPLRSADEPSVAVAPLLQSWWGQSDPFNLYCPMDESTARRSVTGCVATAVAQLMYYHCWPQRPSGSITYYDRKQYVYRKYDFDQSPAFDWEGMLPRYSSSLGTEAQRQAVAQLNLCAGYACKMAYSSQESTAFLKDAAIGLRDYFGYDSNIHRYVRSLTPLDEWMSILVGELREGRPVLYDGFNDRGGHAFLCDGYDGSGLFHFNWGWMGSGDGYYALSAMNPSDQGVGGNGNSYVFNQTMVCRIQPPSVSSVPQSPRLYVSTLYIRRPAPSYEYVEEGVVEAGLSESVGVGCWFNAETVAALNATVCAGVVRDGVVQPLTAAADKFVPSDNDSQWFTSALDLSSLDDGVYDVSLYYKVDGSDWQRMPAGQAEPSSIRLEIGNGRLRMEKAVPGLELVLAEEFRPGNLYAPGMKTWTLHLVNQGSVRLEGRVGVRMQNPDAGLDTLLHVLAYCEAGDEVEVPVPVNLSGMPWGTYEITPFYCTAYSIYTHPTPDNIRPLSGSVQAEVTRKPQFVIENYAGGYTLYRQDGAVPVTVSQFSSTVPFVGRLYARVFRKTAAGNEPTGVTLCSDVLELSKPATKDLNFWATGPVGLPLGAGYEIVFCLDEEGESVYSYGALTVVDGASAVPSGIAVRPTIAYDRSGKTVRVRVGSAGRISVTDMSGRTVRVAPLKAGAVTAVSVEGLPAGLYIVRATVGGSVQTKEIMIP